MGLWPATPDRPGLWPTAPGQPVRAAARPAKWRHTDAFLDEIPGAYKDIGRVMADAADLVEIRHTLRQIVNVKGE